MSGARAQARVAALMTRHLLRVMSRQRARVAVLWAALVLALGIGIGLLTFLSSIEDSYRARGHAIGGLSDAQVQAVAGSSLAPGVAGRLDRVAGTRYAVPMTQQRVTLEAGKRVAVASAIGVDRSARKLRSAVQRELKVPSGRAASRGLLLTRKLAGDLGGVRPGQRIRVFAYGRSFRPKVAKVVAVDPAIEDVITLPRPQLEALRGAPGRPTIAYVKLKPGVALGAWERRARRVLPANAELTTAAESQGELNHVLDFTVRAPTFVFGIVVLAILGLLIYVLQLMRMLERQEDIGLLGALGSRRTPLVFAESAILAVLLAFAIVPGALVGTPIARYLAAQVPGYLTDVFGFNMQVSIDPGVVAIASAVAFVVAVAATIAALVSARGSVAEQLGRSPQAGATVVTTISLRSAGALLVGGVGGLGVGLLLSRAGLYPVAAVTVLLGLALLTPGVVGLAAILLGRGTGQGPKATMVARAAIEANPRRAAMAAAIMALGIAAVVSPLLAERAIVRYKDHIESAIRPGGEELIGSDDSYYSVPITEAYARRALHNPAARGQAVVFSFVDYRGRKVELRGMESRRLDGIFRNGFGLPQALPQLHRHPRGVLISRVMAAGLGLEPGDTIRIRTARGPRRFRIVGEADDISWPSGTVYMDLGRYRHFFRTDGVNAFAVSRARLFDPAAVAGLKPLKPITGTQLTGRIDDQMNKSTQGLFAMRVLTLLAALVAVSGIIATAVLSRRREWAVLRAIGMGSGGLFAALALETLLVMAIGGACGAIGGIVSFLGPGKAFLESQGYRISADLALPIVAAVAGGAALAGALAAAIPAWLTARVPLADALSYE